MDLYKLLNVEKNATQNEIHKSYKELAKKYHPDKNPPDEREECEKKFKEMSNAYQILSDPEKKQIYDRFGMEGLEGGGMSGGNPFDIFENMSNLFGGVSGRRAGPQKLEPVVVELEITLPESYKGVKKPVEYRRALTCNQCDGTGAKSKEKKTCETCKGKKVRIVTGRMGPMVTQQQVPCNDCSARGYQIDKADHCPKCKTQGHNIVSEKINIDIPKGVGHGDKVVREDLGNQVKGLKGDLIIVITQPDYVSDQDSDSDIGPTGSWNRSESDLHVKYSITLLDALVGFKYPLYHLDGRCLCIEKLDVTRPGQTVLIQDEGMPSQESVLNGDLYLQFDIIFPDSLDETQKETLLSILNKPKVEIPDDAINVNYTNSMGFDDSASDQDNEGPQNVQCAQQ